MLIVCPNGEDQIVPPEKPTITTTLWTESEEELCRALADAGAPTALSLPEWAVRCGNRTVGLSARDVHRIGKRFVLLTEQDFIEPQRFTMENLQAFLQGSPETWTAFAPDLPVQRDYRSGENKSLEEELEAALDMVAGESDGRRTFVLQLPCEAGAGATTLLRAVAFAAAGRGYPTLVLRQEQVDINLEELLAFAQSISEAALASGISRVPPILLVFDVEHSKIPELSQLATALASHGRHAIILQALSLEDLPESAESRRRRRTRLVPLKAQASPTEIQECATKFLKLATRWNLPMEVPSLSQWEAYASAMSIITPEGRVESVSLFWIALRFFLVEGMGFSDAEMALDALGNWIRRRTASITDNAMLEAAQYIAALSAFRIASPLWTVLRPITGGAFDTKIIVALRQLSGLVIWGTTSPALDDQMLRFAHPTLAGEFLRQRGIRSERERVSSLFPVLAALKPGHSGDVWLAEILASSVLAPHYEERHRHAEYEWRLSGFEAIPPSIREQSKAILHHWARCLYHSGE
jgi:hypothetical protein